MKQIVVIGGGAAGLMAAITAAEHGAAVTLLEPNERLGKKVNITGKGRCNVTNDCGMDELMQNIPRNSRFLYSAFSRFDGRDCKAYFERLGVPMKTERGNRVFPVSDSAFDVTDALRRRLKELNVKWERDRALSVETKEGRVTAVRGEKRRYAADAAILATGGVSYPGTGSTGNGFRMAAELGHTVIEPKASLVPLVSEDADCAQMQGLSLKNVEIKVKNRKNKVIFQEFGEMLFTHFGLSGPLILSASAHIRDWEKDTYRVCIDLKPALDEQKLEARLLRDFAERSNQDFSNVLGGLVNKSMIPVIIRRTGIPAETKANSITKEQRRRLLQELKCFEISLSGTRPVAEAIVTSGGVKVGEIAPATMESKKVAGLYFAGELIDVDAYTGGFNLQIAWATGRAAGEAAATEGDWE
ncbi:MAG: NAD(P)/FAD-dependent oxidoreductase [Oscillospiraceae bacterium]|nr:NAD(P)/FAD-dependent oxidoreductase [Oscillospiraceae bacterium]